MEGRRVELLVEADLWTQLPADLSPLLARFLLDKTQQLFGITRPCTPQREMDTIFSIRYCGNSVFSKFINSAALFLEERTSRRSFWVEHTEATFLQSTTKSRCNISTLLENKKSASIPFQLGPVFS